MGKEIFGRAFLLSTILVLPFFITGCLSPIKNEIPLVRGSILEKPSDSNKTRLVIYNDSDFVAFGLDGSGRINVKLNGQGVAQVRIGQYVQVVVPQGKYQVDLVHFDTATFSSEHHIELNSPISFLEIFATPTSNKAFLVSHPPPGFNDEYKPVKD